MAIGFARIEFVKRSAGKNACAKAAYNSRSEIEFLGNKVSNSKIYDWSGKQEPAHHDALLPDNVDEKFKNPATLWNSVEQKEMKSNAQVAMEVVLALPDDKKVNLEDKIHLARSFVQKHFVDKGLAAQIDIHAPNPFLIITRDNQELGLKCGMRGNIIFRTEDKIVAKLDAGSGISFNPKEFTGFVEKEHNWHAHVLITTRRFKANGLEFEDNKARDLMPRINKGRVISGPDWGKLWAEHQNNYFQEQGLDLRVDANGIIPQEHLGPFRMRARAFSLLEEHHRLLEANEIESRDPKKILESITAQKSVFIKSDVENFFSKHLSDSIEDISKDFWNQPHLVQLVDKQTGELLPKFTSQKVLEEEQQILRLTDRIYANESFRLNLKKIKTPFELTKEQLQAFQAIIQGRRLSLIHGYAGTGKSHLLKALHKTYEEAGYRIRAFGPDNATADVLREKGFPNAENIYRFLFGLHNGRREVSKGKEIWILDEAGKLGNRPLLEFLKEAEKKEAQVILSGDPAQLPPVERGGMFKVFCNRYSSQILEDIQRQKLDRHREIARNLATGDFGSAIDKLCISKGIRWSENKKESMEELILQWANDTKLFPQSSTLIVAHTNDEVRVLNEMVRIIRKQRKELGEKEFLCTTWQGNIYVSVGDRIEFRRKDNALGISNGLSGTLIEAQMDRFVVSVKSEGQKQHTIVFNPQEYHAFQLGYSSTFYRSQGNTIDRAYVLHSPWMNKELFYVGLTRHVKDVYYFVSKEEASCLADLKRLALKSSAKDLTIDYTTLQDIDSQRETQKNLRKIQELKESESFLNRARGYGLDAWNHVVGKTSEIKDRIQDRSPCKSFYNPSFPDPVEKSFSVVEISEIFEDHFISNGQKKVYQQETHPVEKPNVFETSQLFDKLNTQQQVAIKSYFKAVGKASDLKHVVDLETESKAQDIRDASHFSQWQKACGHRNQSAYELKQKITSKEMSEVLDSKNISIIEEQASRYEFHLAKKDSVSKPELDEQLKTHLEPLLYRLYPEGPLSRDRTSFRFGKKGSLSIVHSGSKAGQFYDFEQQEGGGILKLVERELGLGRLEALTWAQEFLGNASEIPIPSKFSKPVQEHKLENEWVSLRPDPVIPAPKLEDIKGKKLGLYFTEVNRHAYKDENGHLLYYVLRLNDKNDPSRKITPPLSFGYWKSNPQEFLWELKGFQSETRSLYNLHLIRENPLVTVLVVEGEKTADLALGKFRGESYICVTWPGGAGAAQKADWAPLQGRKVMIWPDNDQAGYKAAESVCHELRKVGVESLQLVDQENLKRSFPEKWDLADTLPSGSSDHLLQKLLASALPKAINADQVLHRLSLDAQDPVQKARINEILWRVDERLRPTLEQKHGVQFWKIHEEILKETLGIFSNQDKKESDLKKYGVDGLVLKRLSYQVSIFEAQYGRELRMSEIHALKEIIREHGHVQVPKTVEKNIADYAIDKSLTEVCDRALHDPSFKDKNLLKTDKIDISSMQQTSKQSDQGKEMEVALKNELGRET